MFLFLLLASSASALVQLPLNANLKAFFNKYYVVSSVSSNSSNDSIRIIFKQILYHLFIAPKQTGLKETPGIISLEAPSSRFDIQDITASNSCMLHQNPCL
jgi:hypothetical protein